MTLAVSMLISFLAVRGFRMEITASGFSMVNTQSFNWLLLFLFFILVLSRSAAERDRRLKTCAALFGLAAAVFYSAGICFEKTEGIAWVWGSVSVLVNFLNLLFSCWVLYYCFAFTAFQLLRNSPEKEKAAGKGGFSFKRVLLFWAVLLVFYIPWYLYCYPGVLTYDSGDQIRDALSTGTLNNHHSAFLDLILRAVLLPVKSMTGSVQTGVGICMALQMMAMTFVFAVCMERIFRRVDHPVLKGLAFLWFAVYPVHPIYSVTLWKDIPFSLCFLVLMLFIDSITEDEKAFFRSRRKQCGLVLTFVLLPLMRHNGLLINVLTAVFFFFRFGSYRKQAVRIFGAAFVLLGIWYFAILPALNVKSVESGLILSAAQQQIARTLRDHHDELNPEELAALERYFDIPEIWNEYTGTISDPVKSHFREKYYREDPGAFFRLWIRLGLRYPAAYLEAFLHNNYGYWFPETQYWVSSYGVITGKQIEDLHTAPIWKSGIADRIYNMYAFHQELKTPLLALLFSRGACWWLWLFCGFRCLYDNRRKLILFLPGLCLWLSVLISPVYDEYRYVYGLFAALPLILISALDPAESGRR